LTRKSQRSNSSSAPTCAPAQAGVCESMFSPYSVRIFDELLIDRQELRHVVRSAKTPSSTDGRAASPSRRYQAAYASARLENLLLDRLEHREFVLQPLKHLRADLLRRSVVSSSLDSIAFTLLWSSFNILSASIHSFPSVAKSVSAKRESPCRRLPFPGLERANPAPDGPHHEADG
jgi:acyl-CoA synthetase (NDP forming)